MRVWVGMWNLGCLTGKGGKICEELIRRVIDVCCLQEVGWRGQGKNDAGGERKDIEAVVVWKR